MGTCIEVNDLTKSFHGRTVVDGISFRVRTGEVFGLLGHNGAGKSTTIDLLLGLKKPDKGTFKVLPEIRAAACIFHRGSYDTLHQSYVALLNYIEENGYEIAGTIRESYIDGVWNKETEKEWLTEIQIPVKKE